MSPKDSHYRNNTLAPSSTVTYRIIFVCNERLFNLVYITNIIYTYPCEKDVG